jgi:hypothetical protein
MIIDERVDEIERMICSNEITKEQVFTKMKYFIQQLQKTAHSSDYAKCKSVICKFYDETMECNCSANEDLCEKCMNSQHFA